MRWLRLIYSPMTDRRPGRREPTRAVAGTAPAATGKRGSQRRGVALIMVMVITVLLAAIAADLENEAQVNLRAAANARDNLQAHFHARSALELELFVLRFQNLISSNPLVSNLLPVPLFEMSGFLVSSDTIKGIVNRERTPQGRGGRRSRGRDQTTTARSATSWARSGSTKSPTSRRRSI